MSQAALTAIKKDGIADKAGRASLLNDLVQSSKNLPRRLDDIDILHLSLKELQQRAHNLRKYNKTDNDVNMYTKAHYLLIGKGFTVEEVEDDLEKLEKITKSNNIDYKNKISNNSSLVSNNRNNTYSNIKNTNLGYYMYKQKDENILSTIENSLSATAKDFDKFVNNNINLDWNEKKKELCDQLSNVLKREPSNNSLTLQSPEKKTKKFTNKELIEKQLIWGAHKTKSLISNSFKFNDVQSTNQLDSIMNPNVSYGLRKKFEGNAEIIYDFNEARKDKQWYKIATSLSSFYKSNMNNNKNSQIQESFIILRSFCENLNDNIDDKLRPGRFTNATYSKLTDFESINLREQIVLKSKEYLETQFRDYIDELFNNNLNKSTTTTTTTTSILDQNKLLIPNIDKVMNYIDKTLKTKQKTWKIPNMTIVNGVPLWAILFYLLRAGCYNEAIILVSKYEDSFQKLEKSFPFYLKSYCESDNKKLSDELQGRLNNEFNQYMKNSSKDIDPFRYAVYKIIGRCDLARKTLPSIVLSIEDWLWLHLSLIKEEEGDDINVTVNESNIDESSNSLIERYRLVDLQKNVLEFGSDAFNVSSKNPMYLQTLLLVGLFEDAIKYSMTINEIDSIHLAIILNYYGLIRVSDETDSNVKSNNLMNIGEEGFKSINFSRMIGNYVKNFKFSDPRVACEYLFLICLSDGGEKNKQLKESQIELCRESIRELVLESREFVLLLGKLTKTGTRIPGIIEDRKSLIFLDDTKSYLYNIAEKAAERANEEGRLIDCILLYQLSEEYDTVLTIVEKLLGDFINSIDLINNRYSISEILNNIENEGESNIIKLSDNLLKIYNSSTDILSKTSIKNRINCQKLLDIFEIIKEFLIGVENNNLSNRCISIMEKVKELELIPIVSDSNDISKIRRYISEFNNYNESIMKNIPSLLIIEMTCIRRLIEYLTYYNNNIQDNNNINNNGDNINNVKIEELKQVSKNCVIFAGLIKYKMPREIYGLLINLEINV